MLNEDQYNDLNEDSIEYFTVDLIPGVLENMFKDLIEDMIEGFVDLIQNWSEMLIEYLQEDLIDERLI